MLLKLVLIHGLWEDLFFTIYPPLALLVLAVMAALTIEVFMYKHAKVDRDLGLGNSAPTLAALYSAPSLVALGVGGYGLSRLLGIKKKHYLTLGLPAAYLAYVLGKNGNGLGLWNGIGPIDNITHRINNAVHSGLLGMLNEEGIGNRLYYGGKLALEGALKNDTHIPESGEGMSLLWHYSPALM